MEGKVGPTKQFVLGVPNFNANKQSGQFYNFGESDKENTRIIEEYVQNLDVGLEFDQDFDGEDK